VYRLMWVYRYRQHADDSHKRWDAVTFMPGPQLPSQHRNIAALLQVPNYYAVW